jgi:cell division septum initiation protein DivIVA
MFRRVETVPAEGCDTEGEPLEGESLLYPPHLPGDLDALLSTRPCFRDALRGYDRRQVDSYVAWAEAELLARRRQADLLLARLGEARAELELADRLRAQSDRGRDLSAASDRVGQMLQLAAAEASSMTDASAEEAERILIEARMEADARLRKAQEIKRAAVAVSDQLREQARRERAEAAGTLDRARREAEALLRNATAERDRLIGEAADAQVRLAAVQDEVDDLRRQRDEARQLLRRLTEQIGQALDAVTAVVPNERILFDNNVAQLT